MKRAAIILAALALAGCEDTKYPKREVDQEKRAALFAECMKLLPAGPVATKYNDWDEVVEACSSAAYYQALYCYADCPPPPSRTE